MMKENAYGVQILITKEGSYYWCHELQDVSFIKKGERKPSWRKLLPTRDNTYGYAVKIVAKHLLGRN